MSKMIDTPLGKKNMDFIVKCLRSHDTLVEAAQKLSDILHLQYDELANAAIAHVPELAALDTALAKAKE